MRGERPKPEEISGEEDATRYTPTDRTRAFQETYGR